MKTEVKINRCFTILYVKENIQSISYHIKNYEMNEGADIVTKVVFLHIFDLSVIKIRIMTVVFHGKFQNSTTAKKMANVSVTLTTFLQGKEI